MNTLFFVTPGRLDTRAITVFGLSAKEGENPIGYFGTGLKYAIAVILREGGSIHIETDGERYDFIVNKDTFRDKEFESISMLGALKEYNLPFTTELGKNWVMWQAFRELYCNTLDERGYVTDSMSAATVAVDGINTVIAVHHQGMWEAYMDRGKYFIDKNRSPLVESESMDVYVDPTDYMFYRSIRVGETRNPCLFTWNQKWDLELTEDRTIKYNFMWDAQIAHLITASTNEDLVRACVTAPDDKYEACIDFGGSRPSETFLKVMADYATDYSGRVNSSARRIYEQHTHKSIGEKDSIPLNAVEAKMLQVAKEVCNNLGTDPDAVPIIVTKSLGTGVLGLCANRKVFLSKEVFTMGTKMVTGTLYEELLHHEMNIYDMTRSMQNFLINRLITLYEENTGEPL